jgi:hypothetical protein
MDKPKKELSGILYGTEDIIRADLGNHNHGSIGKFLHNAPENFSPKDMLTDLIAKIECNLKKARHPGSDVQLGKSTENWRESPPTQKHNTRKPERDFEHHLVEAGKNDANWIWWNQMPIASGLVEHTADKTRAIDLACQNKANPFHYRLIELKINRKAGTPLSALMEILRYGLVYFVLRKNRGESWLKGISLEQPIFKASLIELCVLAPQDYFTGYKLDWLETSLTVALNELAKSENFKINLSSYWPAELEKYSKLDPEKMESYLTYWNEAYSK